MKTKEEEKPGSSKRITVSSYQMQEEDTYRYWNSLTPYQRLDEAFRMHQKLYGNIVYASRLKNMRVYIDLK